MSFNHAWLFLKSGVNQDFSKGCPLCGDPYIEEPVYPLDGSPAFFACYDCGIKASQGMIPYATVPVNPEQRHPLQHQTNEQAKTMSHHMAQGLKPQELEFIRDKQAEELNLTCSHCNESLRRNDLDYGACLNCFTSTTGL